MATTADTFAKEFDTEREANRAHNRLELYEPFNGRKATLAGVIGPQANNKFYPHWVHYVEVR
jgi:hypothetical protein